MPQTLFGRAWHWIAYRLRLRKPRLMAHVERELPLRSIRDIYTPAAPRASAIPNVVHQTWIDDRVGRRHRDAIARARAQNPDFAFHFYTDAQADAYMAERFGTHPIHSIYNRALFGPLKIDIWRYCMLFDRGGVYIDIGKAIGMPLAKLIPPEADAVISWEKRGGSPYPASALARARLEHPDRIMINWAMMFAPGHPLLRRVLDGIVAKYPTYRGRSSDDPKHDILRFTGPHHLTECLLLSAEAGELANASQAGIEFHDTACWGMPGAWVRYIEAPPYELARGRPIVA